MTKPQYLTANFRSEDEFTAATHRFINANYPELRHFYFHIPNESATNALTRIKLANMGVLAGVPDLCFIFPKTVFIELKMPNSALSPKQKALHKLWTSRGIEVYSAFSARDVCLILDSFL